MSACPHPEKARHRSYRAALAARDSLERVKGIDPGLKPYRCECGAWHLGHRHKNALPGWMRRRGKR